MLRLEEESDRDVACHPYGEYLMKEASAEVGDFKIGGRIFNKVRFADDTAIIAKTMEELQDMVTRGNQYYIVTTLIVLYSQGD